MHLRPFVDLIRGAEPATPEEHYAGSGYGSQSHAASDASMAGRDEPFGLPAQALPASAGGYQARRRVRLWLGAAVREQRLRNL